LEHGLLLPLPRSLPLARRLLVTTPKQRLQTLANQGAPAVLQLARTPHSSASLRSSLKSQLPQKMVLLQRRQNLSSKAH
jgi:hypothetical protein